MKLAFCLFKYFPYGGVQRDLMRVVLACRDAGHQTDIYTMSFDGEIPDGVNVYIISVDALSNHKRAKLFIDQLLPILADKNYDLIIGFNKMPGLDLCFVGDVCFKNKLYEEKNFICRFLPRYKTFLSFEKAVFDVNSKTQIMLLTPHQKEEYHRAYQTSYERMMILPPGLKKEERSSRDKKTFKQNDRFYALFIASDFYNKGLDRAMKALKDLNREDVSLYVVGPGDVKKFQKLSKKLNIDHRVKFLGAQKDLSVYFEKADILIHPARVEAAGMVLLEAIIKGVPVLTTEICGYAFHVKEADAGMVLKEPFSVSSLTDAWKNMLDEKKLLLWHEQALSYADKTDFYSMGEKALKKIEA